MKPVKLSTQIDDKVLKDLKAYAKSEDKKISSIITLAVSDYLNRVKIRPDFHKSMEQVIKENSELLKRLAK